MFEIEAKRYKRPRIWQIYFLTFHPYRDNRILRCGILCKASVQNILSTSHFLMGAMKNLPTTITNNQAYKNAYCMYYSIKIKFNKHKSKIKSHKIFEIKRHIKRSRAYERKTRVQKKDDGSTIKYSMYTLMYIHIWCSREYQ